MNISFKLKKVAGEEAGEPVKIDINCQFFPGSIGAEREKSIYDGFGIMLSGLLEPEEAKEFLAKFEEQRPAKA